jgi:enterochelin esterase-like enzyme
MRFLAAALLLAATLPTWGQPAPPPPPAIPIVAAEPDVHADRTVTFDYQMPSAARVGLQLEGLKDPIPMQKNASGAWTVTTSALTPEWYSYHFLVDGQIALDPRNPEVLSSYLAAGNGFLVPAAELWQMTAVPHGVVHHHTYTTEVVRGLADRQSDFYVYTPPGYDPGASTKYPVLYLLHGWSDTAGGWTNIGHANLILDNLIAAGKARPMIVVMPLGYGDMSFVRSGFGVWQKPELVDHNTDLFEQALATEVIPRVEKMYNVSTRREDRAIAGLSMGGLESLTIGLHRPGQFAYVGGFSAAVHLLGPSFTQSLDPESANLKLLYIGCGTADGLYQPNLRLEAALKARGFHVTTTEMPGGLHDWLVWRPELIDFASAIFH